MGIFKKTSLYVYILLISFKISAVIINNDSEQKFNDNDFNIFTWEYKPCVINIMKFGSYKKNINYLIEALEEIDFDNLSNENKRSYNKFATLINDNLED